MSRIPRRVPSREPVAVAAPEPLLSPEDAARLGGCTPRVLCDMARRGALPVYRLGTGPRARLRFKWSEIEAALRSGKGTK